MTARIDLKSFPFYRQLDAMDCGPTCLQMVAKHYGKFYSLPHLRAKCYIDRAGVSLKGIAEAAETIGFRTLPVKVPFGKSTKNASLLAAPLPAIAHWKQNHFIVVYKVTRKYVWLADPGAGKFKLRRLEFEKSWLSDSDKGVLLLLQPSIEFNQTEGQAEDRTSLLYLFRYLKPHRKLVTQLVLGLVIGSVLTLAFPFLTQAIVDVGIQNQNIGFIYLVLFGQLALFAGQTFIRFIQNWILLHIGVRLNIGLISDFLIKLMRLPIGYFDAKMTGDLLQRIGDHKRIENFLTQSSLSVLLSAFNLVIFSVVLLLYSLEVFLIFLGGALLYVGWILLFLKKRAEIDYRAFQEMSNNQNSLIEIIQGMQEIKLQNSYQKRRWDWTRIQARLFKVQMNGLEVGQWQDAGALFFTQLKDILITVVVALAVIEGSMTLGMMLAIQFIIGQLNAPLQQLIGFIRTAQDARISLTRLNEIHEEPNEEIDSDQKIRQIPAGDLQLENVSFRYTPLNDYVLQDIKLTIPRAKVTAIVGTSGSGKTTLIKLLLGFYPIEKGKIKVGNLGLPMLSQRVWREQCGVVMQDGYIFSDTIARNIAESDDEVHYEKLQHAVTTANIADYVNNLPLNFNTMIGARGNGLSQGQRQRLLIARAVYKDPEFLFFDEATNALDANNERQIMENLDRFFEGRTVVVVAHRLSTVKNADQIVVLEQGKVVEVGNHQELTAKRGAYYTLVKNQLELGS